MAEQTEAALVSTGQKRGPGRPPKSGSIPNKRQKRDSILGEALNITHSTPPVEKKSHGLPVRLHDARPLPTLTQPQALALSDSEYASIATSGVLSKSLEQSRISWTQTGVFDRYWTKPETGKNARPPPPNNPDVKSMKSRGKCRLRIEPHIFEVEVYVVEKPRPMPLQKQHIPPIPKPNFSQPWQSPHTTQSSHTASGTQAPQNLETAVTGDKKSSLDPVIGLLATRAGSDPELKALMREVAAGNAPPEQLKVFQRHIDELNEVLKKDKDHVTITAEPKAGPPAPGGTQAPAQHPYSQSKYVSPSAPPSCEVVFAFTTPGATNDRFLFPQHCILEALTPQHLLASFIIRRKGDTATNNSDIDMTKEYWMPVTIMVEVAYGREGILKDVHRWVKSPDESREHMRRIMSELERMPDTYLALRLPLKGTAAAETSHSSKVSTPVPLVIEEKKKRQYRTSTTGNSTKRSSMSKGEPKNTSLSSVQSAVKVETETDVPVPSEAVVVTKPQDDAVVSNASGRPTRTTRKSTRISEA